MPTEKQNVLNLPELTQISMTERGIEIVNDGDIIVRAKFPNASIRSLNGDVHIFANSEKQTLANVEAPNGLIKIVGEDFEIMEVRAKEVFCDVRSLQTKLIRSDGEVTFNRGRLQANAISAHSLHFSGTEFIGQHVGVQEDAHFSGDSVNIQVVTGTHVDFQLRATLKVGKLTAHTETYLAAKSVDIDYLSAKHLRVTPQTQGVIVCLDGPAPSEPNSIVGMLSPATFLEKIPALTGLIRELQSPQQPEKLLAPTPIVATPINVTEIKTSQVVEIKEDEKSALLEKPPEFYRTSSEIPIPYKELADKQKAMQEEANKAANKEIDKEIDKEISKEEEENIATASIPIPMFEPDLSPSGPIFEPDLAPSTPLFELPGITGLMEPVFEPNKVETETVIPKQEIETTNPSATPTLPSLPILPSLELPPIDEEPFISNSSPLNITNSGPIDLGLDSNDSNK